MDSESRERRESRVKLVDKEGEGDVELPEIRG